MKSVKWLFFDIGSTLVDESQVYEQCIRDLIDGSELSYEEVYDKMEEFYRQNKEGRVEVLKYYRLKKPRWNDSLEVPYPDAASCLQQLHRLYHIGILANQNAGLSQRLERFGLLPHIDLVVSSEIGFSKPDARIFHYALELAQCSAHDAVMIGDRLDNDITPAKALGMRTIWIQQGFSGLATVRCPEEEPDVTVKNLRELTMQFLS